MKPFVSVITPTKDRPYFLKNILRNFFRQNYSLDNMELIIGDDSKKSYDELIPKHKNITYKHLEEMSIGKKRNILCEMAKGDIIVFMDDDDFYPHDKVTHVVDNLWESNYMVSGSSIMHVYYICFDKIFRYGPYNQKNGKTYHTTCGTMSFKKEYFKDHKFPDVSSSEERLFLQNWTVDVLQLDSLKSILCIAHLENTIDKHKFIKSGIKTDISLSEIIINKIDIDFYSGLLNKQGDGEFNIIKI